MAAGGLRLPFLLRGWRGATESELIAGMDGFAAEEIDFHEFFALDFEAVLVFEGGDDLVRLDVDDFAGGRVGEAAVDGESDPAGLDRGESMLSFCFGGMTVLSKTWRRLLWASVSQSSFSSGVSPMPWLGQPWRLVSPVSKRTSTRWSFLPVLRSPISKPSSSLTLT